MKLRPKMRNLIIVLIVSLFFGCSADKYSNQQIEDYLPKTYHIINEDFEVFNFHFGSIGSIDGYYDQSYSVELLDKNETTKNIFFSVIMDTVENEMHIMNLLRQKDSLRNQLENAEFLLELIREDTTKSIHIHYSIDRSFSRQAQITFLTDMPEDLKNTFEIETDYTKLNELYLPTKLDSTLLISFISDEYNWSRWLVLPKGQVMLWQLNGVLPFATQKIEKFSVFNSNGKITN